MAMNIYEVYSTLPSGVDGDVCYVRRTQKTYNHVGGVWVDAGEETRTSSGIDFQVEARTSDPSSPVVGQIWLRTDL